jgi:uncharacterized protein (DUF433 family)
MATKKTTEHNIVVRDPDILGGTPIISGTRIPVKLLDRLIATGYPDSVIAIEYPSLTIQKILAYKNMQREVLVSPRQNRYKLLDEMLPKRDNFPTLNKYHNIRHISVKFI